jgi:hypothetical protein
MLDFLAQLVMGSKFTRGSAGFAKNRKSNWNTYNKEKDDVNSLF